MQLYPDDSLRDITRALSLIHSRTFISSGIHVWVPGVDLCNHSLTPNATVRCRHNPDECQGAAATEEIAPPVRQLVRPSCFDLIAGERGISAGEEVTISYGSWPNDVFLLFFGFVPTDNPNDSVVLFGDLEEVVDFVVEEIHVEEGYANLDYCEVTSLLLGELEESLGGPEADFTR